MQYKTNTTTVHIICDFYLFFSYLYFIRHILSYEENNNYTDFPDGIAPALFL